MPRQPSGRVLLTVKIDPDDRDWLDAAAARRGIDRSECLRRLIAAHRQSEAQPEVNVTGGHPGSAPISRTPKVTAAPATGGTCAGFAPSTTNPLKCTCGWSKAAHR